MVECIVFNKILDKGTEVSRGAVPIHGKRRETFGAAKLCNKRESRDLEGPVLGNNYINKLSTV